MVRWYIPHILLPRLQFHLWSACVHLDGQIGTVAAIDLGDVLVRQESAWPVGADYIGFVAAVVDLCIEA